MFPLAVGVRHGQRRQVRQAVPMETVGVEHVKAVAMSDRNLVERIFFF